MRQRWCGDEREYRNCWSIHFKLYAACLYRHSVIPSVNRSQRTERHTDSTVMSCEAGIHIKDQTCKMSNMTVVFKAENKTIKQLFQGGFTIKMLINCVPSRSSRFSRHWHVNYVYIFLPAPYIVNDYRTTMKIRFAILYLHSTHPANWFQFI